MCPQQTAAPGEAVWWGWSTDVLPLGCDSGWGWCWPSTIDVSSATFGGGLKTPQETQIFHGPTSERSTRHGHEHRSDTGEILSASAHHIQQPVNSTGASSA